MKKTSKAQYRRLKEEILELLDEVLVFEDSSNKAKEYRVKRAKDDFFYFFNTYFPHYCEESTPKFHKDLIKEIEKKQEIIPVAAPRGFAKSTIITFAYAMWKIYQGEEGIIPIIMDTGDQAEEQTTRIKLEIESNPRLINDYGQLKTKGEDKNFVIESKLKIKAYGAGQKPRGMIFGQHRPKLVLCDDLENDEAVENPVRRKKLLNWFLKALYPAIHPTEGKIFVVGTVLHFDSLLKNLLDAHDGTIFKAIKSNGQSLWSERFPISTLKKIKGNIGNEAFEQEYMNNPIDEDNQDFRLDQLYFYKKIEEEISGRFAYIDPALGKNKKSDYPALIVGYKGKSGTLYVEDCLLRKVKIEKTIENIFMLNDKHGINMWGVEFVAFQEVLKKWIDEKSRLEGKYLSIKGYSPKGSKDIRIKSLVPLVTNGTIKFKAKRRLGGFDASKDMRILIEQFINYPKDYDDGLDGVHGLVMIIKKKNSKIVTEERVSEIRKTLGQARSFFRRG